MLLLAVSRKKPESFQILSESKKIHLNKPLPLSSVRILENSRNFSGITYGPFFAECKLS